MKKESLHLGEVVRYDGRKGMVDALTQTGLALVMEDGSYVLCGYGEVSYVEES